MRSPPPPELDPSLFGPLSRERPVLVTGATGFLGGAVVRSLLAHGVPVRATGRNLRAGLALQALGADFRPVDLRDGPGMRAALAGVDAVVHSAADVGAWGPRKRFVAANVLGTEHVLAGCRAHGVRRLVFVSSPAVASRPRPQYGLSEGDPLPDRFTSYYGETKKLAEDRVRASEGPPWVILRPRAIFGPGDRALLPRIVKSARSGRLPIIGDGETVTNLTYVDDVVQAVVRALTAEAAVGGTYYVAGDEDVRLWDVVGEVLEGLGVPRPSRRISFEKAGRISDVLDVVWRLLRLPGEPPLTRYTAGLMAFSQTFDVTAAKRDLGFAPQVPVAEGVRRVLAWMRGPEGEVERTPAGRGAAGIAAGPEDAGAGASAASDGFTAPSPADRPVGVEVLRGGACRVRERVFLPGGSWAPTDIPALFALIRHPEHGPLLFDTGYAPRFFEGTRRLPQRLYRYATPVCVTDEETAAAQVAQRGIAPEDVRWIVLSHLDPDHYGGLRDFPNARIALSWRAFALVADATPLQLLKARVLPAHLPDDLAGRVRLLPDPDGPAFGPFGATLDLFGDGAVRLVSLPGHHAGQLGALVTGADGRRLFLCADATWSRAALATGGGLHRLLAKDGPGQSATYALLRRLRREQPDVILAPTHCPQTEAELVSGLRAASSPDAPDPTLEEPT